MSLTVTVTNPTKQSDKLGQSYTSYMVNVSTNKAIFPCKNSSVVRRFRDFCWLEEELSKQNPGIFLHHSLTLTQSLIHTYLITPLH
jgi:hypothetical protein